MVDPEFRGMKLSRRLYDARKEVCREKNLARIIIAGRIPGYDQHAEEMSAREYIEKVVDKAIYDPVLTAQLSNGSPSRVDPQLPAVRHRIPRLRDVPRMEESRLRARRETSLSPCRSSRFGSVSSSTRCGTIRGFDEFAQQCEFFLDTASDYKCDFVLFPELVHDAAAVVCRSRHAPGWRPASWRSSRLSTSSSSPRWRSSTTST